MIRTIAIALFCSTLMVAQDHQAMINEHGDDVMGFSHEKTTHHFELNYEGGAIDVRANDVRDTQSRDQICSHFRHIAQMFADGLQRSNPRSRSGCSRHCNDDPSEGSTPLELRGDAARSKNQRDCRQQGIPGRCPRISPIPNRRAQNRRLPDGSLTSPRPNTLALIRGTPRYRDAHMRAAPENLG